MGKVRRQPQRELARGINALSRSAVAKLKGSVKHWNTGGAKKVVQKPAAAKAQKYYPADDERKPLARKFRAKTAKLKASIQPGSVLILLSGRFRGKRVVFLKQLASGLLLVTGPYKVNGVPLRRVNQAYVIGTSATVDVSKVQVADKINDAYFARPAAPKKKAGEEAFFEQKAEATPLSEARKNDQKQVDDQVLAAINSADKLMSAYLKAKFSLKQGQYPHAMQW